MRKPQKTARPRDHTPTTATGRRITTTALKWVGGLTAILSLAFGLHQLAELVSTSHKLHGHLAELLSTGRTQEHAGDFAAALKTLEQADQLVQDNPDVQAARADLAMHWLETRLGPDERRFDASAILPVVERAASTAKGRRKADLLAHAGWAEFLRSDDGAWQRQSREYYNQALQIDSGNVYAHAMQGYWALWSVSGPRSGDEALQRRRILEARREFSLALAGGREHEFVRRLQLDGLGLEGFLDSETDIEFLRVVNDMRKSGEAIPPQTANVIMGFFADRLAPSIGDSGGVLEEGRRLSSALPTAELFATFSWLFDRPDLNPSKAYLREYYRAVLQEASGNGSEALKTLLKARPNVPSDDPEFETEFQEAIRRLSRKD